MRTTLGLLLALTLATAVSPALAQDSPDSLPGGTEADRAAADTSGSPAQPGTEAAPAATGAAPASSDAAGDGAGNAATDSAADASGDDEDASSCSARIKAYQDSLACFGRYRINANVMDPVAFKNCKAVAEPTDCTAAGSD